MCYGWLKLNVSYDCKVLREPSGRNDKARRAAWRPEPGERARFGPSWVRLGCGGGLRWVRLGRSWVRLEWRWVRFGRLRLGEGGWFLRQVAGFARAQQCQLLQCLVVIAAGLAMVADQQGESLQGVGPGGSHH